MISALLIIILLWIGIFFNKAGYYLYLWQVKEYRFRRFLAELKEPGGFAIIINRGFAITALLLIGVIVFPLWPLFYSVTLLYFLEFLLLSWRLIAGQSKLPVFTVKSLLLFLLSFGIPFLGLVYVPFGTPRDRLIYLLIADIAAPLIVTFFVILLKPFTYLAKQYIVAQAKARRRAFRNLTAIGISGSVGKTSTKEFLAHILGTKFKVAKTREHQNTEIGAARALLGMRRGTEVFVAEMGAYHKGDIKEISDVVKPAIGIITSLGYEHLALFGSLEATIETELELAYILPSDGTLIVNWDNEYIKKALQDKPPKPRVLTYSTHDKSADLYASDIKEGLETLSFTMHYKGKSEHLEVQLLGKHNVSNILAAAMAGLHLGMKLKDIASAASTLESLAHTMKFYHGIGQMVIIDDSYNASMEAVKAGFAHAKRYKERTRVVIMPSLIELGDKAQDFHKEIGKAAGEIFDFAFITDKKYESAFIAGWKEGGGDATHLFFRSDPTLLAKTLEQIVDEKTLILIEGRVPRAIASMLLHHFYV